MNVKSEHRSQRCFISTHKGAHWCTTASCRSASSRYASSNIRTNERQQDRDALQMRCTQASVGRFWPVSATVMSVSIRLCKHGATLTSRPHLPGDSERSRCWDRHSPQSLVPGARPSDAHEAEAIEATPPIPSTASNAADNLPVPLDVSNGRTTSTAVRSVSR